MRNLLLDKGIRVTTFRKSVLSIIENSSSAVSMEWIEQELGEHDRITLYRTIKTFLENGIIHEINLAGEAARYALCEDRCNEKEHVHQHQHIHFKCKKCEEVYCVPLTSLPTFLIPGYQIEETEIQLSGSCAACLID